MFVKEFPSVAIDEDDEDTFQHEEDVLLRWVSNFKSRFKDYKRFGNGSHLL